MREALPGRARIEVQEFLASRTCATGRTCAAMRRAARPRARRSMPARISCRGRLATSANPVLADRAAVAARVAPLGGIAAESMRQATRLPSGTWPSCCQGPQVRPIGAARQMIAAEGLNAVGAMIAGYRDGGRFATDYEIARIRVALRDLRVRDDAWARMDPAHAAAHQRLWIDVVRRAQPRYVAARPPCSPWRAVVTSGHGAR